MDLRLIVIFVYICKYRKARAELPFPISRVTSEQSVLALCSFNMPTSRKEYDALCTINWTKLIITLLPLQVEVKPYVLGKWDKRWWLDSHFWHRQIALSRRWPNMRWMSRSPLWRQVRPILLRQHHLSAVLLWKLLGQHPLKAWSRVSQASRQRRRRPTSCRSISLVLTVNWLTATSAPSSGSILNELLSFWSPTRN